MYLPKICKAVVSSEKLYFSWWWSLFKKLTKFFKDISCLVFQRFIFPRRWSVLSTPVLPWPHCTCHQLDRLQSTCWGQVQDWKWKWWELIIFAGWWQLANQKNRCQHIRRQYETGHQVVAKVLATDNSSFTQVQNEICQLHQDECQRPCITFVRPGLPPGWTWWVSWKTLSRGFSQEGSWGTRDYLDCLDYLEALEIILIALIILRH